MAFIPFDGQYKSGSLEISNQELVNCYLNIPQTQTYATTTLLGAPGIKQRATTGKVKSVNRGAHVKDGAQYVVNGEKLYRIDYALINGVETFTPVELGTIPGESRCSFADNGKQLMVLVPGGDGYIVDETAIPVFQTITDADFKANGNPQLVVFIDSFFVAITDEKKFIKSAANDGLNWNPLDFGSAESDPDDITSIVVHKNRIYIGGSETIEEFQNAGLGGFPFQRTGLFIPKGVSAPFSMINIGDTFMWIGAGVNESPAIWLFSGGTAQKASTTAIDTRLRGFSSSDIESAFSLSYAQDGHYFVIFQFPSESLVYDLLTGKWHERKSQIVNTKGVTESVRSRINSLVTAYGRIMVADSQDGRIGELDPDTYTEYGNPIIRSFNTLTIFNDTVSFSVPRVELTMEPGVGNADQPDPEIRMSISRDAKKFGDPKTRKVGAEGNNKARQVWRRMGRFARMCVIKFEFSDPCKFAALRLDVDVRPGVPRG